MTKKVLVSGCFDMLHSGHMAFFEEAAKYGEVHVGIGSDKTVLELKGRPTVCCEEERLYMVSALRHVHRAYISPGSGKLDFADLLDEVKPDIFFVNSDGASEEKRKLLESRGIEYIVSERNPYENLPWRSTTELRKIVGK
jgi:cytidyltransferase-like protein